MAFPFKKPELSEKLFIVSSLTAFIMVGIFYFYFRLSSSYQPQAISYSPDKYYLSTGFKSSDPLVTKTPNLKDMLAGPIISSLDPSLGTDGAPVTVVMFSDFTCGYCRQQEQVVKKILENYGDKIKLQWKDYPDSDKNSLSYQAAIAARCAAEQNKFWTFHDLLYDRVDLDEAFLGKAAGVAGLDIKTFNDCLASSRGKRLVNDNILEANALGITGVPFIYVNDQEVMGEINYDDLERIVRIELEGISQK